MTASAMTIRARIALVVVLAGVAALVGVMTLAPTMSAQSVVALAILSAAAVLGTHRGFALPAAGGVSLRPRRRGVDIPLVLAGRTTDVVHHPVRPRAPGRV